MNMALMALFSESSVFFLSFNFIKSISTNSVSLFNLICMYHAIKEKFTEN